MWISRQMCVAPSKIMMMRRCSGSWMISAGYGVAIMRGPPGGRQ
jgi:hypothetical protein